MGGTLSRSAAAVALFILQFFLSFDAYGQPAPKAATPAPNPAWQSIDVTKLDAAQCQRIADTPPQACAEGDPGAVCRVAKSKVELACKELVGWSVWDYLPKGSKEKFVEYAALIIFAVLGLAVANLLTWINALKASAEARRSNEQIEILEDRALDPFFERPADYDQFATNMILIGEGGSGKTALLHALTGAAEAKPDVATPDRSTYTLVHEISIEQKGRVVRRLTRIYSDDYEGQNWVQGVSNDQVRSRQKFIPSSTLVVVVDLVAPGSQSSPAKRRAKIDTKRVREQLGIYNDPAIQTLAQLLGPDGQVILFINKIDLIYPFTDDIVEEAKAAYNPLIEQLSDIRGARIRVLVGSAATGESVVGFDHGHEDQKSLLRLVLDHAEKIDIRQLKAARDGKKSAK